MDTDSSECINLRYVSSISDEPKQLLQPITGYAREPLLSLEEACEPLLPIVPQLSAYIWIAKQNSKNPEDGLTQDESAAIRLYTMEWDTGTDEPRASLYIHLNQTLRLVDRTKLRPWFRYLKLFLTGLAKLPLTPRQTVWRGVRKNHSDDYPQGAEITWWSFSSCTTSLSVLESDLYLGNVGTRTLFSIEAINGRTIRSHSHFITEDEILLLPGTYFEVKSRLNPAPDLYIIHMQQKIPPHALLEPPFKNAEIFPPVEHNLHKDPKSSFNINNSNRPWYKQRKFRLGAVLAILLITTIVLLSKLLTSRKDNPVPSMTSTTMSVQNNDSFPTFFPVSVGYAFYSFDRNVLDLYSLHDGKVNGGVEKYTQGYVGTGQAIILNQSNSTWISISNSFNLNDKSFTIEAFIIILNNSINAKLVQFSSGISINIRMGYLEFFFNENYKISTMSIISINIWYHIAVVYNVIDQYMNLYVNGKSIQQLDRVSQSLSRNNNITMTIGSGFVGIIDQLSISLEPKPSDRIQWDATVAAFYPFDGDNNGWLLDIGPNCLNATSAGTRIVPGQVGGALSFPILYAYYQANGFTTLNIPNRPFTIALWIRLENQPGIFLTIANSITCLLVLGIRNTDNHIVAYLPNATNTSLGMNIVGSSMINQQWTHIAFTWSTENQAQLYRQGILQGKNTDFIKLNSGYGEPMTITLGMYRGNANCTGGNGLDIGKQFFGSIDDLYIYSRELQQNEIENLM